jgi:hypothetical protein
MREARWLLELRSSGFDVCFSLPGADGSFSSMQWGEHPIVLLAQCVKDRGDLLGRNTIIIKEGP